jgi:hypothetical protein
LFFSSFRRIATMPHGSRVAEIGLDVCPVAHVVFLMAARRTCTTRRVWIASGSASGVPPHRNAAAAPALASQVWGLLRQGLALPWPLLRGQTQGPGLQTREPGPLCPSSAASTSAQARQEAPGTRLALQPQPAHCTAPQFVGSGSDIQSMPRGGDTASPSRGNAQLVPLRATPSARSAPEREATQVAIAATLSSRSARPALSSASHSGTTSDHGSNCQTSPMSQPCRKSSSTAAPQRNRHDFCPYYDFGR